MRISSLHHETSVQSLMLVQEIEPKTWEKISLKVKGANSIKQAKEDFYKCPENLPYMFKDWQEYGEHLIENMVQHDDIKIKLYKIIERGTRIYLDQQIKIDFWKKIIDTILLADWDFVKYLNWERGYATQTYIDINKNVFKKVHLNTTKYLNQKQKIKLLKGLENDKKKQKNS